MRRSEEEWGDWRSEEVSGRLRRSDKKRGEMKRNE